MQVKSPHEMQVVKWEEKAEKLSKFIVDQIDRVQAANDVAEQSQELLLVALSTASPVVTALKAAGAERNLADYRFRVVLANIQGLDCFYDFSGLPACSASWANNARLLDAHEQLVIGGKACWTGDCMRREPSKRDAFECYTADCIETVSWARTSFERIWKVSQPLINTTADSAIVDVQDSSFLLAAESVDAAGEVIARTRH